MRHLSRNLAHVFVTALALAGCSSPITGSDSGADGGTDARSPDAGRDAPRSDAPDAPIDAFTCDSMREDLPDLGGFDVNCDGIDGDPDLAIFVATAADGGDDANPGTRAAPVATIAAGLTRAAGATGTHVYVAIGDYSESLDLVGGVSVFGGFDPDDWSRPPAGSTRVLGGPIAVRADALDADVELQRLTILAANAALPSDSSVGVLATGGTGTLSLVGCAQLQRFRRASHTLALRHFSPKILGN